MSKRTKSRMLSQYAACLLLFIVWLSPTVEAQTTNGMEDNSFTLKQCIDYALTHQKSIENAKFETYIAQQRVKELRGIGLPQVSAAGNYQQYFDLPVSIIDVRNFALDPSAPAIPEGLPDSVYFQTANFGIKHNATVSGQISQLLFDGSWIVGLQAAKEFANLNEINLQRSEEEASVNVAKAYYNALAAEERSRILSANVTRLADLLSSTEALYKEGFVEKVDADRLRIQLNNLQMEEQKVTRLVLLGYDLLKFQMGMPVDEVIVLEDRITDSFVLEPLDQMDMTADYSDNRLETRLFEKQIQLNELDIKRNRLGGFGTLAAFGSLQYTTARPRFFAIDLEKKWFPTSLVGIQYNITIFDGLQKRSRLEQTELKISQLRNNMDIFRESVMLETRSAITQVNNAYADVEIANQNLDLAQEVYRISTTKYQEGIGSNLEVINAESTLMESQINQLAALYAYNLARIELQRVKGGFVPSDNTNSEN